MHKSDAPFQIIDRKWAVSVFNSIDEPDNTNPTHLQRQKIQRMPQHKCLATNYQRMLHQLLRQLHKSSFVENGERDFHPIAYFAVIVELK